MVLIELNEKARETLMEKSKDELVDLYIELLQHHTEVTHLWMEKLVLSDKTLKQNTEGNSSIDKDQLLKSNHSMLMNLEPTESYLYSREHYKAAGSVNGESEEGYEKWVSDEKERFAGLIKNIDITKQMIPQIIKPINFVLNRKD